MDERPLKGVRAWDGLGAGEGKGCRRRGVGWKGGDISFCVLISVTSGLEIVTMYMKESPKDGEEVILIFAF